ncbi:MAG TPA: hypothetical protein VMY87_12175 [Armatimonadota bacterium]|nr:hypothetical protein [Armatimonadota bacterium]
MGIDNIPSVERTPAPPPDEPRTRAVEPDQRPPPIAPSQEDRWERNGDRPEDDHDHQPPPETDGEEEEGEEEDTGQAEADDKARHLDARA